MSMVRSLVAVGLIVLTLSATAIVSASDEEQLVTEGKKLFRTQCARCHGIDGAGGEGANLKRKRLKHAVDDEALVTIINWGIPGTGMPSSILSELEVQELAAYVRFLGQLPEDLPPGDKNRGAELFTSGACLGCHIVKGVGKAIGPELTSIGDQRGLAYLKEALMAPATTMPSGAAPLSGAYQGYLTVHLATTSGQELEGIRINEDAFSIQIRDMSGLLLSFDKDDLTKYEKRFGHSFMPGTELGETDLNDIVSYLMSLKEPL